jgi:hypothetical protein
MGRRIGISRIVCAAVALLGLDALAAHGVEYEHGEWRRVGASFACKVDAPRDLPPSAVDPNAMLAACLHLGPFVIGGDARTLASALGPPHETMPPQPKGAKALLWFLGERGQYPYFIATVLNGRIVALQVTGEAPAKDYGFNHVSLGDSTQTLAEHFGPAFGIRKSDQVGTDQWSYPPWPFSFEVKAGRVTSIRIIDSGRWQ